VGRPDIIAEQGAVGDGVANHLEQCMGWGETVVSCG
jgi:hypothetical protein